VPHATHLSTADSALLVIDVQEKLVPLISDADALVRNIAFLLDAAQLLNLPIQCTEQYPHGLGPTVPRLAENLPLRPDKVAFSCCAVPSIVATLHREARPKVVLCGIEAHVCVLNTALDLLALDFRVYIVADAVASRSPLDRDIALRRLEQAGAILTTSEMCVFEWIGGANHPQFKAVSRLIQERMKAQKE
jgi:nicotinamidase-related amidase